MEDLRRFLSENSAALEAVAAYVATLSFATGIVWYLSDGNLLATAIAGVMAVLFATFVVSEAAQQRAKETWQVIRSRLAYLRQSARDFLASTKGQITLALLYYVVSTAVILGLKGNLFSDPKRVTVLTTDSLLAIMANTFVLVFLFLLIYWLHVARMERTIADRLHETSEAVRVCHETDACLLDMLYL